jgi:chromosome segregation ATPase
LRALVESLD